MPLLDQLLVLATDIDVTADANGATVTVGATGTLGNLGNGTVTQFLMRFDGTIEYLSGDEVLDVYIEEYDGTTWYALSRFPRISWDTATKFNYSNMQSDLGIVECYGRVHPWATALRYRVDVTGTIGAGPNGWNDMNIWVVPTNFVPDAA